MYHLDPSGTFTECSAKAIGSASEGAMQQLEEQYHSVSIKYHLNHYRNRINLICHHSFGASFLRS